jgi:hypothetical protein
LYYPLAINFGAGNITTMKNQIIFTSQPRAYNLGICCINAFTSIQFYSYDASSPTATVPEKPNTNADTMKLNILKGSMFDQEKYFRISIYYLQSRWL